MFVSRLGEAPEQYDAETEDQGLADNPGEAQAFAAEPRRHFAHDERAKDSEMANERFEHQGI
ncbi:hypothetical protein D3C72_2535990 [compost metagenome]